MGDGQWCRGASGVVECAALADGTVLDLSAVNVGSSTEGLILPQATNVSAGIAEGQISWDSDDDALYVGTGAAAVAVGGGGTVQQVSSAQSFGPTASYGLETFVVQCNPGSTVLGGGVRPQVNGDWYALNASCPSSTTAWTVTLINPFGAASPAGSTATVYALCLQ